MNRKPRRIPAAAMVAALTLFIGSVTAVAAWQYLTTDKVAEVMEDEGLKKAFQSKDAIPINESKADREAADKYLKELEKEENSSDDIAEDMGVIEIMEQ